MPRRAIGVSFLLATVSVYACIGMASRTTVPSEYYVAGRRVPAMYNGMATAADWMSAASFIGLAGTLYLSGYGGLAFILGWTGGYCLVALLLAPYLRKFGQFTIPDFLGERYGGRLPRAIAVFGAILCSFTYVVAQIYGVGLITTRLSGLPFEIGVFAALGSILLCSFLGGMRAVTWTQVAQYIVLIVAYLLPVVWLSIKQTGVPVPQLVYGHQLQQVGELERKLRTDPRELQVIAIYQARADAAADKLRDVPAALAAQRTKELPHAGKGSGPVPRDAAQASRVWSAELAQNTARTVPLGGMPPHAQAFAGDPDGDAGQRQLFDLSRRNFLALVFCLMMGTAALPHILVRYYTTPSVKQARESVGWSLLFIVLLYVTAPALAVLVKHELLSNLVGMPFERLAQLDRELEQGRSRAAVGGRHQSRRDPSARRAAHRCRRRRAGHARDRRHALRGLGAGGRGRSGRRAVHRRRPAADHFQRAGARPVLQDDQSAGARPHSGSRCPRH